MTFGSELARQRAAFPAGRSQVKVLRQETAGCSHRTGRGRGGARGRLICSETGEIHRDHVAATLFRIWDFTPSVMGSGWTSEAGE